MIDYTQLGFAQPPVVNDPLPSVADYLDQYQDRNRSWYEQWAYPLGGGRFGARPESFEVRAPWLPPEVPTVEELQETTVGGPMGPTDSPTGQGDMVAGAITPDPEAMTNAELWDWYLNPAVSRPTRSMMAQGTGIGLFGSLLGMGAQGTLDFDQRVINEMGRRMGALYPPRQTAFNQAIADSGGTRELTPGGPVVFTGGDILPQQGQGGNQGETSPSAPSGLTGGWDDETGFGGA